MPNTEISEMVWTIVLMKLFATLLTVLALYCLWRVMHADVVGFWSWVRCETGTWSGEDKRGVGHNPKKQLLGGYRCERCGVVGASLDEFEDADYHILSRKSRQFVRAQRSAGEDWQ